MRTISSHAMIGHGAHRFGRRRRGMAEAAQSGRAVAREARGLPGLGMAAVIAVLTGLASWFFLLPAIEAARTSQAAPMASDLAEVSEADIKAALGTLANSNGVLGRFRTAEARCEDRRLAWMTLTGRAGDRPG